MQGAQLNAYRFSTESGNQYIFDNVSGMVIPCPDDVSESVNENDTAPSFN